MSGLLRKMAFAIVEKLDLAAVADQVLARRQIADCAAMSLSPKADFHREARVFNFRKQPEMIRVGEKTQVRGELLVFPYGGEIEIGSHGYVGEHTRIWSGEKVTIGNDVLIAHGVNIIDTTAHEFDWRSRAASYRAMVEEGHPAEKGEVLTAPITIEDHAWISVNAIILRGVRIGRGSVVAAGSVVTKSVPAGVLVAGNPARIVRELAPSQ